jgi:hypothetical protein
MCRIFDVKCSVRGYYVFSLLTPRVGVKFIIQTNRAGLCLYVLLMFRYVGSYLHCKIGRSALRIRVEIRNSETQMSVWAVPVIFPA